MKNAIIRREDITGQLSDLQSWKSANYVKNECIYLKRKRTSGILYSSASSHGDQPRIMVPTRDHDYRKQTRGSLAEIVGPSQFQHSRLTRIGNNTWYLAMRCGNSQDSRRRTNHRRLFFTIRSSLDRVSCGIPGTLVAECHKNPAGGPGWSYTTTTMISRPYALSVGQSRRSYISDAY